ncbi:MAG: ROK family protein [Bacteroidetes bacterium]|nr:MAG: ROK family protein [Bacteroidota bacterium]
MAFAIGIDVGGSHISGGIVNITSGEINEESYREKPIDPLGPKEDILTTWKEFISMLMEQHKDLNIKKIGFAMPGPFDYENGIGSFEGVPKYNSLNGVNVRRYLQENLDNGMEIDIVFKNDATAFARGEYNSGAAKHIEKVWVLTLGTGFGSTFLIDGNPALTGAGMPEGGYFWNQSFKDGIADQFFSTRWFENNWKERTGQEIKGVKPLVQLFDKGNTEAVSIFRDFAQNLSDFLAPWLQSTDAKGVVIGGGIARAWDYFAPVLETNLKMAGIGIILRAGSLGKYAPVIGAVS